MIRAKCGVFLYEYRGGFEHAVLKGVQDMR